MLQIEIHIPRPFLTLCLVAGVVGLVVWSAGGGNKTADGLGGSGREEVAAVKDAEEEARMIRMQQIVLAHREEILRYQLDQLTEAHERGGQDAPGQEQIWQARQDLVILLNDKMKAEERLKASFQQMWEAQGGAMLASIGSSQTVRFLWPVPPSEGISAYFQDAAYRKRFGIDHLAVDIPALQGTTIEAPADGVVLSVADKGMGFNSLTIRHNGGVVSLYGHVSTFLVAKGQRVHAGDPIALTGGMPGTPGAGWLTTGPHLHFQVLLDGQPVDPLEYLPELRS